MYSFMCMCVVCVVCGVMSPSLSPSLTGTAGGDLVELTAMDRVFFPPTAASEEKGEGQGQGGQGRGRILLGSVKTNVGHCEAASGLVGLIKVCLAYRYQCLPANLHYNHPRESIRELLEQKFEVVTQNTPWSGGVAGVSSYGFGGVCAHLILAEGPPIRKMSCQMLPKCAIFSSRTEQSLQDLSVFLCREYTSLSSPLPLSLSATASLCSREHPYRGFVLAPQRGGEREEGGELVLVDNSADSDRRNGVAREVWWVFTGMGAHWSRMGEYPTNNAYYYMFLLLIMPFKCFARIFTADASCVSKEPSRMSRNLISPRSDH